MKRYRYTDVPSLLQEDRPEDEAQCYRCKLEGQMQFHHILNGSLKRASEEIGAWVWLCPACHDWVHSTGDGVWFQRIMKATCQERYEENHTREEWMALVHKNYLR